MTTGNTLLYSQKVSEKTTKQFENYNFVFLIKSNNTNHMTKKRTWVKIPAQVYIVKRWEQLQGLRLKQVIWQQFCQSKEVVVEVSVNLTSVNTQTLV